MKRTLLAACLAAGGCTTAATEAEPPFATEAKAYLECNAAAAVRVARQEGEPLFLAAAAEGQCLSSRARLLDALVRYRGAEAQATLDRFRRIAIQGNAGDITRIRDQQ